MLNLLLAGANIGNMAGQSGSQARSAQNAAELALIPIESRLEQLELACAAMWELLRERAQLTDAELLTKIEEIDLRDGVRDHKMKPMTATCPHCHRKIATKSRVRCIWCGQDLGPSGFRAS